MRKEISRYLRILIPLAILFYLVPIIAVLFVACGLLDIARHRRVTRDLAKQYFFRNGLPTWLLSPFNLFLDLISSRNKYVYRLAGKKRGMLFYKWYDKNINEDVPAFNEDYTYIKTIGVSVFNQKESTSLHFGPLRLTLRVLYNLTPFKSDNVFIEVDGKKHFWHDDPLFIFDDTLQHRSINEEDRERYCVFVDVLRPSRFTGLQNLIMKGIQLIFIKFNGIFYKNWTFLK